ncbi:hypothetical protein ACLOJK_037931 [Asimina triloba]
MDLIEPIPNTAIRAIKPTVLIGSSGVGRAFTREVVEAMTSFNEKPIILALSNPTSQSECTAEEAYTWSKGRAIFASGSPFDPVEYNGKTFVPGQANNAYVFPGLGLGLVISGAIRVHDDMLLAASEALAKQVTQENFDRGLIYPPFTNIRKISAHIAANVAAKAYELGECFRKSDVWRPVSLVQRTWLSMQKAACTALPTFCDVGRPSVSDAVGMAEFTVAVARVSSALSGVLGSACVLGIQ